ncbi:helix-turn-helix transcriptional regulator [Streptomyces sp. Ag109_G2-15]|uniref:ArsR/SmtB family transcription factor n=1 Tax=Streptomyces sp. Ag109_G2-15 TaxID=1938850 RepID=UPI0015CF723C|nr:helix-turn-helix domain-containing protein [Streptomyces sp. Ag109_G2-15]
MIIEKASRGVQASLPQPADVLSHEAGESACSPDGVGVPRSTLSNHWRILHEAGITQTRRVGKARLMALRRADLDARFPGLLAAALAEGSR